MNIVKEAGSNLAKFGSAAGGLVVGSVIIKKVSGVLPDATPEMVKNIAPGLAGMIIAYFLNAKFSNQYVKNAALGLGLAGLVDATTKLTAGATSGFLKTVNENLPTLKGLGYVQDYGQYSADYFSNNWPLNGADQNANMLQGADRNANILQGTGMLLNGLLYQ